MNWIFFSLWQFVVGILASTNLEIWWRKLCIYWYYYYLSRSFYHLPPSIGSPALISLSISCISASSKHICIYTHLQWMKSELVRKKRSVIKMYIKESSNIFNRCKYLVLLNYKILRFSWVMNWSHQWSLSISVSLHYVELTPPC